LAVLKIERGGHGPEEEEISHYCIVTGSRQVYIILFVKVTYFTIV
jgi:hypothetical protein